MVKKPGRRRRPLQHGSIECKRAAHDSKRAADGQRIAYRADGWPGWLGRSGSDLDQGPAVTEDRVALEDGSEDAEQRRNAAGTVEVEEKPSPRRLHINHQRNGPA
jgi:hypothetical protein